MKRNVIVISFFVLLVPCFTSTMDVDVDAEADNIVFYEGSHEVNKEGMPFNIGIRYYGVNTCSYGEQFINCHFDLIGKAILGMRIREDLEGADGSINFRDRFYHDLIGKGSGNWFFNSLDAMRRIKFRLKVGNMYDFLQRQKLLPLYCNTEDKKRTLMTVFEQTENNVFGHVFNTIGGNVVLTNQRCSRTLCLPDFDSFNTFKVDLKNPSTLVMTTGVHEYLTTDDINLLAVDYGYLLLAQKIIFTAAKKFKPPKIGKKSSTTFRNLLTKNPNFSGFPEWTRNKAKRDKLKNVDINMAAIVVRFRPDNDQQ